MVTERAIEEQMYMFRSNIDKAAAHAKEALNLTPKKGRSKMQKHLREYVQQIASGVSVGRTEARRPVREILKEVLNNGD